MPISMLRTLSLACLALIRLGAVAQTPQVPVLGTAGVAGHVMAIGGALRDDHDAVWSRLVALAGGRGARFAVLATASGNPDAAADKVIRILQSHGAVAMHVRVTPGAPGFDVARAVRDPALLAQVNAANGVFMSGGAQARLIDALQPGGQATPLLQALRGVVARGGVVAGTSAGAAVLSEVAFRDAPDVLATMKGRLRQGHEVDRGFGLLAPDILVDQHAIKRGRIGRMLALMVQRGLLYGLSVEEDSAAIVQGHEVQAIGARGVLVADLRDASHDASLGRFNLRGARLTFMASGDRYDLQSRRFSLSEAKQRGTVIDPNQAGFKGYFAGAQFHADMLGDNTIVNAMIRLVDSDQRQAHGLSFNPLPAPDDEQPDLGFEWRLWVTPETLAWAGNPGDDYSVKSVGLDIAPVRMARPLYRPFAR